MFLLFRVVEDADTYLEMKSLDFKNGILLWNRGNVYYVIRYPTAFLLFWNMLLWIAIHHVKNLETVTWSTKIFDYSISFGSIFYGYEIYINADKFEKESKILDKWWTYTYLEKEREELKRNTKKIVEKFSFIYYNCKYIGFKRFVVNIYDIVK